MAWNKGLTDKEIELLAQAFLLPPPFGFTEQEKKQILDWVRTPSAFVKMAERKGNYIVNSRK
jgi:hypothetical protein